MVPETGCVYCFYGKSVGKTDFRYDISHVMQMRYSDDDGWTWSDQSFDFAIEDGGERVLFYPDRKFFLLGKYITDEWLSDCDPGV